MKEYILLSIFLSTMHRSMYALYFLEYILMVLCSLRKCLFFATWPQTTEETLQHICPFPIYVHVEMEEFPSEICVLLRLGLISSSSSSHCFKHRFMWFHRGHSNGKLSVVNRNNLMSYHFLQELACMFSLEGGRLPHLLCLNIDELQVTDYFS